MKLTRGLIAKRRAIADDVIAQIKARKLQATTGLYVSLYGLSANGKELQKELPKLISKKKPCTVCAIGSIFLSSVYKFDKFKLDGRTVAGDTVRYLSMREKVSEFFNEREQSVIECSFEIVEDCGHPKYEEFLAALDNEPRLLWLMDAVGRIADKEITYETLRNQALLTLAEDKKFAWLRDRLQLI